MKKYFKYVFAVLLLLMIIAQNKVSVGAYSNEYTIEGYDIDMIVNENNTFEITEKITANFRISKHGIFRKIPLKNSVTRNDGTKSTNKAKVSNISVNDKYTTYKENGYQVIKIGSSSKTYTGRRSYTIKYTYNIGKDPLKNLDELYFNLIGDEWDTSISNTSFKITMPKAFDKSLLGFSSGTIGSTNSSNVYYSVDGNVINGRLQNTLYAGQALTVRLELPEGYFVGASSNIDIYSVSVIVICLICVLIAFMLWVKYGKNDEIIETVEFYPPGGYNSAEVGFLYKGTADTEGVISLLIYLANKGYLKIEETEEQGIFKKSKGFRITKLKEYEGNNEYEMLFFNGLFKSSRSGAYLDMDKAKKIMKEAKANGENINLKEALNISMKSSGYLSRAYVTAEDLYDSFYTTLNQIKRRLNSKENKSRIIETSSRAKRKWLIMMIITIFILITVKPVLEYGQPGMLIFALPFPGIGFSVLISSLIGSTKIPRIFGLIWGGMFGGVPWTFLVLPTLKDNPIFLIMYIIGVICIGVIIFFTKKMIKRTPYGKEILGKLKGFKRFLETAEKPQLESLVAQNPEYFYNILPYTYALGVSNVWISQFETIALQAPNWYDSTDTFNMHSFKTFMNTTMASATYAMSSSPSSDSGGGSGGGSSGGGSGGGGGGSW